jgi:hypothetical protein
MSHFEQWVPARSMGWSKVIPGGPCVGIFIQLNEANQKNIPILTLNSSPCSRGTTKERKAFLENALSSGLTGIFPSSCHALRAFVNPGT